jgi:4-hydroxy-3-methylbut-2-enyl diphosphate reductase
MEIVTATVGFCFGITRAYRNINRRALDDEAPFSVAHQNSGGEFDTLLRIERGDPELLRRYPGLKRVAVAHEVSALREGDRLVLGFHGLAGDAKNALAARGVALLEDHLCPFIAKLDRVVERLVREGFDIAIVGQRDNHHCRTAQTLADQQGRRCYVIERVEDVDAIRREPERSLALVGQVTGNTVLFQEAANRLRASGLPATVVRTICGDSYSRQKHAAELASQADMVLLIDDQGGAAQSVFEICSLYNERVHRVSSKDEIRPEWFEGIAKLAIIGGILVPEWMIADIARSIAEAAGAGGEKA